jgi:hypothetical protein
MDTCSNKFLVLSSDPPRPSISLQPLGYWNCLHSSSVTEWESDLANKGAVTYSYTDITEISPTDTVEGNARVLRVYAYCFITLQPFSTYNLQLTVPVATEFYHYQLSCEKNVTTGWKRT